MLNLPHHASYKKIVRYITAGVTGALIHFLVLITLKEIFFCSILLSTTTAFIIAGISSFLLQKYWTFKNKGTSEISLQMALYIVVALTNVGVNAGLMWFFSIKLGFYYLVAQVITSGLIAIESYILYNRIVFRK